MIFRIANRLKPFSHQKGIFCIVPRTSVQLCAFPTRLRFTDLQTARTWEEPLAWKGPVEGWTVQLDLEKQKVGIFGNTFHGFRRLWIEGVTEGLRLTWEKEKTEKIFPLSVLPPKTALERLSLGKHTQLDWERVTRRFQMEEVAPVLFQLGQLVPVTTATSPVLQLLHPSSAPIEQLRDFLRTGFKGILTPRLQDEEFQGIVEEGPTAGCPLALLTTGYRFLRDLFFKEESEHFIVLPHLPPLFHAGRLLHLQSLQGDTLSLEWSKKQLRRLFLQPASTRKVSLQCPQMFRSFRLNRKIRHSLEEPLQLVQGQSLLLDRFEKSL